MTREILHIVASPRGVDSYSFRLGDAIVQRLAAGEKRHRLTQRCLHRDPPAYLSGVQIQAFYKAPNARNDEERASLLYSDAAIRDLRNAAHIVISTPMYNMAIPASLKGWIDQVIRINVTFRYDELRRKVGMLPDKKMYIAIASGRVHGVHAHSEDFMAGYLAAVFKEIGITDIRFYRVEGTRAKAIHDINFAKIISDL
jgi:FMN-dependent NADH-azoreductase